MIPAAPRSETSRIERFHTLQSGEYWRALDAIPEQGVAAGEVLLIQSLRWADDAVHTVILRPHPSKIGQQYFVETKTEDGESRKSWRRYDEHRFLVDDFVALFEHEPDARRVREEELAKVQGKVAAIQDDLVKTQRDPLLLEQAIEPIVGEARRKSAVKSGGDSNSTDAQLPAIATPSPETIAMASGSVSDALASGVTESKIAEFRSAAEDQHLIASAKATWIKSKTDEIGRTLAGMTPFYEEQAAAALARTEDVREHVARLLRGIETLDLYVGKGVTVETLREGKSAPRSERLTFVQRKLALDEELAIWTDVDSWYDFEDFDKFVDAIRANDGLIEQIFPTPRCVVVAATTRRHIDYGDPWSSAVRNAENAKVFMLVRDGMNVHRVISPVESHLGASRLFPTQGEQDKFFRGIDGENIGFEDVQFTDRLARHEDAALHYKRFLILACGLDHRLKLFGEFHDKSQSFEFVSMPFQDLYCRFLFDDVALVDGTRPPLIEWLREKNGYLASGSRVAVNWRTAMNVRSAPGVVKPDNNSRHRSEYRVKEPLETVSVAIAYREGRSIFVEAKVHGYRESDVSNARVDLTKSGRDDEGQFPYLVLDAVEPDEIQHYLHLRGERTDHISYVRFFKRALKFLEAERAEEADARRRMAEALDAGEIGESDIRPMLVSKAVIAWRAANRGKPLPKFTDDVTPPGWKALLDQMFVLAGDGAAKIPDAEAFAKSAGLIPLRLSATGRGRYALYAAPTSEERDDRLEPHAWVHRIGLETSRKGFIETSRRWESIATSIASETTLHQWTEADAWTSVKSVFPTFRAKQSALAKANAFHIEASRLTPGLTRAQFEGLFVEWDDVRRLMLADATKVRNPEVMIPVGVLLMPKGLVRHICVRHPYAHALLYTLAPDDECREKLRAAFVRSYQNKSAAAKHFAHDLEAGKWGIALLPESASGLGGNLFVDPAVMNVGNVSEESAANPLLDDWFKRWRVSVLAKNAAIWLTEGASDDKGELHVDKTLGIRLPEDYEPLTVVRIALHEHRSHKAPVPSGWIDVLPFEPEAEHPWHRNSSTLSDKLVPDDFRNQFGVSASKSVVQTRKDAMQLIKAHFADAIPSTDLPNSPQPPEGVTRWYDRPVPAKSDSTQTINTGA